MRYNISIILLLLATISFGGDWRSDLDKLLKTEDAVKQDKLIKSIVDAGPEWKDLKSSLEKGDFGKKKTGQYNVYQVKCIDDVERPWVVYTPSSYDPNKEVPMLVVLHGGVSMVDIADDPLGWAKDSELGSLGEKEGWIVAFPFGQKGATWWDEVGMSNINDFVRNLKTEFNVDDERVYMGGFSDGSSASFLYAMVDPTDYAAFAAINGHMGVGSLDADLPTYAPNMKNTPIYATTTYNDGLYPSKKMRATIDMAIKAGADIFYRELEGTHSFDFAETELPLIADFLDRNPRDPFPSAIVWETAGERFGKCRWFEMNNVKAEPAKKWHKDFNTILTDDRITVGFIPDYDFEEHGVHVTSVMDDTLASEMGLKGDDVIIAGGGFSIFSIEDLDAYKKNLKRGDEMTLKVKRNGKTVDLKGNLPPVQNYNLFKRDQPSAKAYVNYAGNRIDVKSSRLGSFSVLIHPSMINMDEKLVITKDGKEVFNDKVKPDPEFMIRNFLENRDRKLVYVGKVTVGK